jgi:predicted P-loop ATPase
LEALVQSIRTSDALRDRTMTYRALRATDKDAADKIKKNFPGFLPAATVSEKRDRAHVTALTGLVMCDFDHVPADALAEVRQKVNNDPHTVLSYVTVSGEGLRVLAGYILPTDAFEIKGSEKLYHLIFNVVNQYYARLTGLAFDPACKDLSRLSFAAFDADAYYQPEAIPFPSNELIANDKDQKEKEKKERKQKNKAINLIQKTYNYRIKPVLKQEGATFGPGTHNNYVMRVGYLLNKYGFELGKAKEWAAKEFAEYAEAAEVVGRCFARTEEHGEWAGQLESSSVATGGKLPQASHNDILKYLFSKFEVRRNLVLGRTEMRWKNPTYEGIASPRSLDRRAFTSSVEPLVNTLICQMEREAMLEAKKDKVYTAINSDDVEEYDPLASYLKSLPKWDPDHDPDYLLQLADTVTLLDDAPNATSLWQRCLKKWFVGMLAGWMRVREVNQTILYLIGAQGTYKSTWCTSLLPPELSDYLMIKQNSGEIRKDDIISMSSYALIVHEEVDAMTPREMNTLKAMSTAKYSDERAPYAREKQRRLNIASMCGTGNNDQFLVNEQGTRRSLVFRVKSIVSPIDHPFDYEGIYSQAVYLLNSGFQYFFDAGERAELEEHNRQFEIPNHEEAAILTHLRKPGEGMGKLYWMQASQIAELLSSRSGSRHIYVARTVGQMLTKLGFPKTRRDGHWGYRFVLLDFEEARRQQERMALDAPSEPDVKDIQDAPATVQDMYRRLLGEKDED